VASLDQNGVGVLTQFDYVLGVTVNYGTGCQGTGGFVPRAGAVGLPLMGNQNFTFVVTRALHQAPALMFLGYSRTAWGTVPLPLDLAPLGAPGCFLRTNVILAFSALTSGGSPGA